MIVLDLPRCWEGQTNNAGPVLSTMPGTGRRRLLSAGPTSTSAFRAKAAQGGSAHLPNCRMFKSDSATGQVWTMTEKMDLATAP